MELVADPKLRIGDIGALVGINNVNTFLRQFKKYTGMTPLAVPVLSLIHI